MGSLRKRPSQQRSREMVEWIVEAAARVFEREGIGATTNRIAEEAGVSVGSLYQYFPDKHALLAELADRHLDEAEQMLSAAFDADICDLGAFVEHLVTVTVGLHDERGGLHRVMRQYAARSTEVSFRFGSLVETLIEKITAVLVERDIDDPHGRARMIVATVDAQVHGVLAGEHDDQVRAARIRLVVDQVKALLVDTGCQGPCLDKPGLRASSSACRSACGTPPPPLELRL